MRRLAFRGILAALLAASAAPARAEADKDARAIIAKAIEAKGGQANLDKYQASTKSFKATISQMGQVTAMDGTLKDQSPDKMSLNATIKVGGTDVALVQVVNGNNGWQSVGGAITDLDKDEIAEARAVFYSSNVAALRGLSAKGVTLKALGESNVGNKPAVGVRVSAGGHPDVSLYFDKDSHLLLKSESKEKDAAAGVEFKGETLYEDFRKVNGLMIPHKLTVTRDGKPFMKLELTSVSLAEKLDDQAFAKP